MRFEITPPKTWEDKSIVIFCGQGIPETHWAYPSIFTGIGGSERMVIQMSQELTKLGYKVTVYNNCGELRGEYDGVTYLPFYHFNPKDNYNILIGWRCPQLFQNDIRANKKLIWLHDIAYKWQFNDESIEKTDKFIFLSKWHRDNMPEINESKVYVSNNGIVPEDYQTPISIKKEELVLTCSYDRGVLTLIRDIMPLVHKKLGRKIKTHICYGWNNIDKELDILPELKVLKHDLEPLFEQDWVIHHGRIGSKEVAELLRTSIIYPYSTEFSETNNMSSQAAQANGCYVLTTTNSGGTPEYLKFGEAMPLNNIYTDKEEQEKYADRLVELIKNPPKIDEESRKKIIDQFSIKETVNKWKEGLL
jgi:glycosyltransferase involved in cell wall biosynthesis